MDDLSRFYGLLGDLENKLSGKRILSECNGKMAWPKRGVYFFFENGELRDDGTALRVVRVGTHAVSKDSRTTLWGRLRQHRGNQNGGGNHRGSIFRLHVGTATIAMEKESCPTWGVGGSATNEVRISEKPLEALVSEIIGQMPFLWLEADDTPSAGSIRSLIERNSIALLSNFGKEEKIDAASAKWRGHYCKNESVKKSGLWNVNHVDERYDPLFLDELEKLIKKPDKGTI